MWRSRNKASVCPNQSHDYYTSEPRRKTSYRNTSLRIVENHVDPPCSTKFNKRWPFVLKKEVPLYRESKLQIATKTIEYIEVNEYSLLTEIVNAFDDIDPNSSFETCFEVFTHPKGLDTPEITSTEKKILQAQEVSFIEISVDQYQVCELEENWNSIANDIYSICFCSTSIRFLYGKSVFYWRGTARNFEHRAPPVQARRLRFISLYMYSP